MAEKSKDILKEYFKRGAVPTQEQFADFIDSIVSPTELADVVSSFEVKAVRGSELFALTNSSTATNINAILNAHEVTAATPTGKATIGIGTTAEETEAYLMNECVKGGAWLRDYDNGAKIQVEYAGQGYIFSELGKTIPAGSVTHKTVSINYNSGVPSVIRAAERRAIAYSNQVPTVQTTYAGTAQNYIYSEPGAGSSRSVVTVKNTYFRQQDGKLQLVVGEWCSDNDNGRWWSKNVPNANTQADGAMSRDVFNRLNTANIRESTASSTTVTVSYPNWANGGTPFTFVLNPATSARAGVMTVADKVKLSNAGVYALEGASRKAVNGIFSLTTASTDAEIKAALTEYETKNVLTLADLHYCAKYGCMLFDQQTRGFVQVANSGGGNFFNFMELSSLDFRYMPCIRFVCIKAEDDGTFKVTRAAMEARICYKSELDALAARVAALEGGSGEV